MKSHGTNTYNFPCSLRFRAAKFHEGRSKAYVSLKSPQSLSGALDDISVAMKFDPSVADYMQQCGIVHLEYGNNDLAISMFKKALLVSPQHSMSLFHLGKCHASDMNHIVALVYYQQAIDCGLQSTEVYEGKGISEFDLKQFSDAEKSFQSAIESERRENQVPAPELRYYIGECRRLEHKFDLALKDFETVKRYKSNSGAEITLTNTPYFLFRCVLLLLYSV